MLPVFFIDKFPCFLLTAAVRRSHDQQPVESRQADHSPRRRAVVGLRHGLRPVQHDGPSHLALLLGGTDMTVHPFRKPPRHRRGRVGQCWRYLETRCRDAARWIRAMSREAKELYRLAEHQSAFPPWVSPIVFFGMYIFPFIVATAGLLACLWNVVT